MAPKLEIENVHKRFGEVTALHPVNLSLEEGEFLTLLGPSGSGKTTLLMMVAGLQIPDGGEIRIDGSVATHSPPYHRDIGMVFQSYALFPHLSVYENIAFPLRRRRKSEAVIKAEVKRVLDLVQLPHTVSRMPQQLSGGQQQRIALARCIVYNPSIILMDEPLGALDKKLRDQLQVEIKRIHKQLGNTILYVTHDQQETLTMSDRVCLMSHGRIEQLGTPKELYFKPKTIFAADFLGDSNIFSGRLIGGDAASSKVEVPALGPTPISAIPFSGKTDNVHIMVRPERLLISRPGSRAPLDNCISAVVTDVIFTGSTTKYIVHPENGLPISVVSLTDDDLFVDGDRIDITWLASSTIVLSSDTQVQQ